MTTEPLFDVSTGLRVLFRALKRIWSCSNRRKAQKANKGVSRIFVFWRMVRTVCPPLNILSQSEAVLRDYRGERRAIANREPTRTFVGLSNPVREITSRPYAPARTRQLHFLVRQTLSHPRKRI